MKTLTLKEKKQALTNALAFYQIPQKYFITESDRRCGQRFAIASESTFGGINVHSNFATYDEMNYYLKGYGCGMNNPLK